MNKVELRARGHGKSYAQFVEFITAVKSGKKAIVVAKDYVVIDSCAYEQLRTDNEVLMEQNFDMNKSTVRLRKALSWYKNADYRADHPWCIGKEDVCIECDGGAIASKALEGK